jgi:IS1 family transposase
MGIRKKKDGEEGNGEAGEDGRNWIWTAIEAKSKLILGYVIGARTLEFANLIVGKVARCMEGQKPVFTTDELASYKQALLNIFGEWSRVEPTGMPGRPRNPVLEPPDDLLYGTVKKTRRKGVVIKVERCAVFGSNERIADGLAGGQGSTINTSYIERSNLDWRMWNAHLSRKSLCFAKSVKYLSAKFAICVAFYNFCRSHSTLTRANGKKPTTPSMEAGVLDCVWNVDDLLSFTVCQ